MNNTQKAAMVIKAAGESGLAVADRLADRYGLHLFAVDVGPGSRIEVFNQSWRIIYASGGHVRKYKK